MSSITNRPKRLKKRLRSFCRSVSPRGAVARRSMSDEDSPPDLAPGETTSKFAEMASRHASRGDMETPQACSSLASPDPGWKAAHALKRKNNREFGGDLLTPGKAVLDFDFSLGAGGASGINLPALSGSAAFNAVLVDAADGDLSARHAASGASRPVPSRAEAPPKKKPKKKKRKRRDVAAKERTEDVGARDPRTREGDFGREKLRAIRNGLRYLVEHRGQPEGTARQAWVKFAKPEGGDANLFGYKKMLDYEAQFLSEHGTKPTLAQVVAVEAWWPFRAVGHSK